MEYLKSIIEDDVTEEFADYLYEQTDEPEKISREVDFRLNTLIKDIKDLIDDAKQDIDFMIYQNTPEGTADIKAEMKYQDSKEANLWN